MSKFNNSKITDTSLGKPKAFHVEEDKILAEVTLCNIPSHPQAGACHLQDHPWTYFSYRYLLKFKDA
jgi:hypothetical protein